MADISKIVLPSGNEYNIADAYAREQISSIVGGDVITFGGVSTTALTDGGSEKPTVGDSQIDPIQGQLFFYERQEFVYGADNKWHALGDSLDDLGYLAMLDEASASYTPEGSVSAQTFTGSNKAVSVNGTPAGAISVGTGAVNYTPTGSVSVGDPTVTLNTTSKYVANSATGGGQVVSGSAASYTLPTFTATVSNETLTLGFNQGTFTANTPTQVTLPSFTAQDIATSVASATAGSASFSGTGVNLKFEGEQLNSTGTYQPEGTISQANFQGTQATITVS